MFTFRFCCSVVTPGLCAASGLVARGREQMAKGGSVEASENLFISDLPANIDAAMLLTVFGAYGHINSHKILPLGSRGNGCALVSFANVSEATWVVNNVNGNIPQGLNSPIMVRYNSPNKATGKDECKGGDYGKSSDFYGKGADSKDGGGGCFYDGGCDGGGGKGGSERAALGAVAASENLFIGDLPVDFTDQQFLTVFSPYGTIKSHKIVGRGPSGKLAAVVAFGTADEAKWLIDNLHGTIPLGLTEPIQVRYKKHSPDKGKAGWDGGKGGGVPGVWAGNKDGRCTWDMGPIKGGCCHPDCSKGFYAGGGKGGGWNDGGKGGWLDDSFTPSPPSENLFVGDLPADFDATRLQQTFAPYGTIKSLKITAPGTSGKLAACISFATVEEAKWLVDNLNGNVPLGLTEPIKVKFKEQKSQSGKAARNRYQALLGPYDSGGCGGTDCAQSSKARTGVTGTTMAVFIQGLYASGAMPGSAPSIGGPRESNESTLFISGLPYDCTDVDLYKIFSPFGAITPSGVHTKPGEQGAICKGYGSVNFLEASSAQEAITTLNGTQMPDGKVLRVSVQQGKGDGGEGKGA